MVLSGRDIQWYIEAGKLVITPVEPEQFQQNGIDIVLADYETVRSETGFLLGVTKEHITMPDDLMGFVEIRSTWARKGIFLPPTIVDAGFSGTLTLEMLMIGRDWPIRGERIIHLILVKTSGPCVPYKGRYQGQTGITHAR